MKTIHFKSCKIGSSIPLEKPATFFNMKKSSIWKEYLVLHGPILEEILKKRCGSKRAYLFEFGCLTFVDFEEFDIQIFLEFISGMVGPINYSMVAIFAENHSIEVDEHSQHFSPWHGTSATYNYDESVIPLIAIILAKSSALNKIEIDVDANIDKSGAYLEYLKKGQLRFNKKASTSIISEFLKFEYESINSIRIFDRSVEVHDSMNNRDLYDSLSEYYELHDRFDVLQHKISSLRRTMKTYNSLGYHQNENRLNLFVIFLLGLFPLVNAIRMFLHS